MEVPTYSQIVELNNYKQAKVTQKQHQDHAQELEQLMRKSSKEPAANQRWKKLDDCKIFQIITQCCEKEGVEVIEYLRSPNRTFAKLDKIVSDIINSCAWKSKTSNLKMRLYKLITRTWFSARELRILKKVMKQELKNGTVDWNKIMYFFPGKTKENIMRAYNKEAKVQGLI